MKIDFFGNREKIFSKKFVRNKKGFYLCAPQERRFIERLVELVRGKKGKEIFQKKLQKKLARLKRRCTFAPASRNTLSE